MDKPFFEIRNEIGKCFYFSGSYAAFCSVNFSVPNLNKVV